MKPTQLKIAENLRKNKKPILIGVSVLVGGYLLYRLVRGVGNSIESSFTIDDEVKHTGGGIVKSKVTISEATANNYAQQLLDAMNQNACWFCYGTDEDAILKVFQKLQGKDDFLMVFKAFGNKDYNGYNSPPKGILKHLDAYKPRNLVYWLKSELSPRDGEVYRLVKQTVESAGFTF